MFRRHFLIGCAGASAFVLLNATTPSVAKSLLSEKRTSGVKTEAERSLENAIKAGFGGGFSLQAHGVSQGVTYAKIQHFDNQYIVSSTDLVEWKILKSSLNNEGLGSFSVNV